MIKKILKWFFYFFLILTIYYFFVWIVLPFFIDPKIHKFEKYEPLKNWDLDRNAIGDFDNDGKKDLISLTGCAFLSSVGVNNILQEKRCTANEIVPAYYEGKKDIIGQKYIEIDKNNIDLNLYNSSSITHSFVAKNKNENWKIFINSKDGLKIYEIQNNGLLKSVDKIGLSHKIDESLYFLSSLFLILVIPILPLSFAFNPIYEVITLAIIMVVFFILGKSIKIEKKNDRTRQSLFKI